MKHLIRLAQAPFDALWRREMLAITSPIPGGIARGDIFEAYEMHGELPTGRIMVLEIKRIRRREDDKLHCQLAYMSNLLMKRRHCRERLGIDEQTAVRIMFGDMADQFDLFDEETPDLALDYAE